jgi:signal transduction histidine kinase
MATIPVEIRRRARFEALRRSIFDEMGQAQARMRLAMFVPFHALVLALLAVRGLPAGRLTIQTGVFLTMCGLFAYRAVPRGSVKAMPHMLFGFATILVSLGNTGGLASPLLPLTLPILAGASITLANRALRGFFFVTCAVGFTALALLSHTSVGDLPAPLTPVAGHPSPEYLIIAFGSLGFTVVTISKFGSYVSSAYERVALELATRREELCNEGADRSRALEGVAARLAHEVKNPLAAIKGLSTHMARSAADPKMAERLGIVAAEADRLQSIVESYLSFSRGLEELDVAPTAPFEIARELTLLLETRAADAGVTLEVSGSPEVELNADARKIRQALLNFVLNAMQASSSGQKVTIDIGRACSASGFLRLRVTDHGAGMTREILERIQKPYFTTRAEGTGLGVAVARGIVEQHGGHVTYESAPGKGTTVVIDLPRCAASAQGAQKVLPKPRCAGIPGFSTFEPAPLEALTGGGGGEGGPEAPVGVGAASSSDKEPAPAR